MMDDEQLLGAYARERSESAFGELVARHIDFVYSTALRVVNGDSHLAQDVAQRVFIESSFFLNMPCLLRSNGRVKGIVLVGGVNLAAALPFVLGVALWLCPVRSWVSAEGSWPSKPHGSPAGIPLQDTNTLESPLDSKSGTISNNADLLWQRGRGLMRGGRFAEALPLLEREAQLGNTQPWRQAWVLLDSGYAYYSLGEYAKAKRAVEASLKLNASSDGVASARQAQLLFGCSPIYSNWTTLETAHFRFHLSPLLTNLNPAQFAQVHERAFVRINQFFRAELPKKIDFFVWQNSADAEQAGLNSLGFSRPEISLVQSTFDQTTGHELTHVLSQQGLKPVKVAGLISEGIAVYFDQSGRHRLESARQALRDANLESVSLEALWTGFGDWSESFTYPVAGAFIERLRIKGGDQKLKALVQDQTLEAAHRIYGPELTVWITEFEHELCGQEHVAGIGIELGQENKTCKILKVLPNSPACKAGLLPGLIVHEVDGVATDGKLLKDCVDRVRGGVGTKVQLELVDTTQSKTSRVELTREKISTSFAKLYIDQQTRKTEAGNRWAAYYLWQAYVQGTYGVDKDPARANKWLGEFLKDVYVVRFEPANGFSPRNAMEFVKDAQDRSPGWHSDKERIGVAAFLRTKREGGKLVASQLSNEPDKLRAYIESNPHLKFISVEPMTPQSFIEYEKSPQESL